MTKTELLTWLNDQEWCDAILGTPQAIGEPQVDGTQWYAVTIREVYKSTAITRRIHFYVVNENTSSETAYWKDSIPNATLGNTSTNIPTYKMITFRTILNAVGADVYTAMRMRLDAAAAQSLVLSDVLEMLKTYGPDGGIDINAPGTQAIIQSLVATNVLTQAEADAVIALAD